MGTAKMKFPSWGPLPENERILTLDVIRGLALFGILLENMSLFAFPEEAIKPIAAYTSTADQLAAIFRLLFVDGKFYPLFCILFGMGIALQSERAGNKQENFTRSSLRRLAVLLLIGILHALLLFSADILAFYAVIAFAAMPFLKVRTKPLLVIAIFLFFLSPVMMGGYAALNPENPTLAEPDWHRLLEQAHQTTPTTAEAFDEALWVPFPSLVTALTPLSKTEYYEFMADEQRIFQSGSFFEMVRYRAALVFLVYWPLRFIFLSWGVLSLFLLGIYFTRRSFFEPDLHRRAHQMILVWGFFLGMALQIWGGPLQGLGSVGLGLSYASGTALLCARKTSSLAVRSLAAAGRMSITNYLGQSVIAGFIMYSYGLGLFGQLSLAQAVLMAVPIFLFQLIFSALWLRYYRFGPVEWLWRTLSYWQIQPMRRKH